MDIARLGARIGLRSWRGIEWLDRATVHDYNFLLVDPNEFTMGQDRGTLQQSGALDVVMPNSSAMAALIRRATELDDFVDGGGEIAVFASPRRSAYQTGSNQLISGWDFLPAQLGGEAMSEGRKIAVMDDGPIGRFLLANQNRLKYEVTFDSQFSEDYGWTPLATVASHPDLWVGAVWHDPDDDTSGRIIVLPSMFLDFKTTERAPTNSLMGGPTYVTDTVGENKFWTEFVEAISAPEVAREPAPAWADSYMSAAESAVFEIVKEKREVFETARSELNGYEAKLTEAQALKPLLYATDSELEDAVSAAFVLLGGTLLPVPTNRADLRVHFDDWMALIEVKGITGSAAEKHANQLEKWAIEEREQEDVPEFKSILIVNAHRALEPKDRKEAAFPSQMLKFATGREQLLMTTAQLYCAIDLIERGDLDRADFLSTLRTTVGVLKGYAFV